MFDTVELPVWAMILILGFAGIAALDKVLVPSVRWFVRRRMERVVARLNQKLTRPIRPFKLAHRHDMIQRLIYDPKVMEAVAERAHEAGIPENVVFAEARRYAREIVPSFSATAYFGVAIRLAHWVSAMFYRVRLTYLDVDQVENIDPDATVIYVMNHRSNMDYFLVTYLAASTSHLSYAVGEWARVWPLQLLIRALGAYFIRRKSGNALYRRVLERYVQMATRGGVTQAIFPEGRLSLTGAVRQPKLGLLYYVVSDFEPGEGRDVVFVPVAINYDRVVEDRVILEAAQTGRRSFRFSIFRMVGFLFRQIWFFFSGRFHKFGSAAVSYGEPLSLSAFLKDIDGNPTKAVGKELMARVRRVLPVLPVPLVASVFDTSSTPLTRDGVRAEFDRLTERLQDGDAHIHFPEDDPEAALDLGLRILSMRRLILEENGRYRVNPDQAAAVKYYASSIAHHLKSNTVPGSTSKNAAPVGL